MENAQIYEFIFVDEKGHSFKREFYATSFEYAWHDAVTYGWGKYKYGLDKIFLNKIYEA